MYDRPSHEPTNQNEPHLGNIIGCVLSGDVFARCVIATHFASQHRYCRLRGYNTMYICGTDEYGTATETKALQEGLTPREICDKYGALHRDIYKWFGIDFNHFGRTSTPQQTDIAQAIFKRIHENGYTSEETVKQPYCHTCKRFLSDRYVGGTCTLCGYGDARGDQCEKCSHMLTFKELKDVVCRVCSGSELDFYDSKHIFINLTDPRLKEGLEGWVQKSSEKGQWTANTIAMTNGWIRDGLKPRCITRDLKWGTPVPLDGFREKVFYVWFDAPIGYISITACHTKEWEQWWKNPDNVQLYQFMGKDNVPFHTVVFPSTLLGTEDPWTMVHHLSTTEYLQYESGKFSKTAGRGVFGSDAQKTGIPPEVWRYYLLCTRPETSDYTFTWEEFATRCNSELLSNLGNFVNRCISFSAVQFGKIPNGAPQTEADHAFVAEVNSLVNVYVELMESVHLREGLATAMKISAVGNRYFQENKPWELLKKDKERCGTVIGLACNLSHLLASLMEPFTPSLSEKIVSQLGVDKPPMLRGVIGTDGTSSDKVVWQPPTLPPGTGESISKPAPLIQELSKKRMAELRAFFAGRGAHLTCDAGPSVKEEVKKGKGKAPSGPPAGVSDLALLDLRVGRIVKVDVHADANSLYVEQIDIGERRDESGSVIAGSAGTAEGQHTRTVVSGLRKSMTAESMVGKLVIVVANLKPAKMRGVMSQGMVLAASDADDQVVELIEAPAGSRVGEAVCIANVKPEPVAQLNPKWKVWDRVQPELKTSPEFAACYKGESLMTTQGPCVVKTLKGAVIR